MQLEEIMESYHAAPNKNKPLKLCHGFPYRFSMTLEQKLHAIKSKIAEYKQKGYGGVVTNVNWDDHYLNSEEGWQLFRYTLQSCRDAGMRVWLYDEKGYPSGGAGGLTLENHPEWQCQAVAMVCKSFSAGEKIEIPFPYGHSRGVAAYAYKADNLDAVSDHDILYPYKSYDVYGKCDGISDINDTDGILTVAYFVQKNMYEGTHAVHNVCESRRYVDVSNREAIAAFIDNTYRKYVRYMQDCAPVEAIFTDEPSYMGAYINLGSYPSSIRDKPDENIEFLPAVNWGADVENRFLSLYGYPILSHIPYLFAGKTKLAKKTRLDFYKMLSDLYEQSFFCQISDYCAKSGMPFSGHVLLEDDIRYHAVFEGNLFSLLRHMHYPGIDMLHGVPELIVNDAFTPKLVSSIAHTYRRPHVMSEVSAHCQGGKVTYEQMLGAVTTQYALGIDVFTSYFGDNALPEEKYRQWNDTIGRIDKIMGGGKHISGIAVYYPIETIQANYLPSGEQIYSAIGKVPENNACWSSVCRIYKNFLQNQFDFDFLDSYALERCDAGNGAFVSTGGERFDMLAIPACLVTNELKEAVRRLCRNGVTVAVLQDDLFAEDIKLLCKCGAVCVHHEKELTELAQTILAADLTLAQYTPEVIYLCRENENGRSMLIVNTANKPVSVQAEVSGFGEEITVYDPQNDAVICKDSPKSFPLNLAPYQAVMIV